MHNSTGASTIDRCIRHGSGRVMEAFLANLGACPITHVEITWVVIRLEKAWQDKVRDIQVQCDSQCAIRTTGTPTCYYRGEDSEFSCREIGKSDWKKSIEKHIIGLDMTLWEGVSLNWSQ
ncbi:hypothetical protein LINPERPRIM_LOCUS23134 [Linum perenne]